MIVPYLHNIFYFYVIWDTFIFFNALVFLVPYIYRNIVLILHALVSFLNAMYFALTSHMFVQANVLFEFSGKAIKLCNLTDNIPCVSHNGTS